MLLFNIFELLTRYQVKNQIRTTRFSGSFVRSFELGTRPHLSNQTNTEHLFGGVCLLVFCQVDPPQQVLTAWSKWEISVKSLSQGHNDALLPVRESNHSQQPFPMLNHCLSPPLFSGQNILYYDCIFLSFKCSRSKISQRIIRNKNPFSHFFAF